MFSPRIALVGALSGAATVALATVLAMPASAAPTSPQCFQAEANVASQENVVEGFSNTLSNDTLKLQAAADKLAKDQAAVPVVPATIAADQTVVSNAQQKVNQDQASLRTAKANLATAIATRDSVCSTTTPTTTPAPTPTPGPVGLPRNLNCAQLAARGIHDIPASSVWYRTALDANGDGIGCETNLNTYRVVNGQKCHLIDGQWVPVTTVTAPCTACSSTVSAPPPVIYQSPPVTVPAPVIQSAPVYVPGPVVSVPNTSLGVNNGDGSTADDPITITVDLGDILLATPLPTLPTLPKV